MNLCVCPLKINPITNMIFPKFSATARFPPHIAQILKSVPLIRAPNQSVPQSVPLIRAPVTPNPCPCPKSGSVPQNPCPWLKYGSVPQIRAPPNGPCPSPKIQSVSPPNALDQNPCPKSVPPNGLGDSVIANYGAPDTKDGQMC